MKVSRLPTYLGIGGEFLGIAAAQPHQAGGEDAADVTQMRWQVLVDRA